MKGSDCSPRFRRAALALAFGVVLALAPAGCSPPRRDAAPRPSSTSGAAEQQAPPPAPAAGQVLTDPAAGVPAGAASPARTGPDSLAAALDAMESLFDADEAMKLLRAIDPYYRVRGNNGYQRSLERLMVLLKSAGFSEGSGTEAPREPGDQRDIVEMRDFGPVLPAWTPVAARLEVVSPEPQLLHAFEDESGLERTFLCVNSFPTRPEGVVAPLVRYDPSKPVEVYAGTVVYGGQPAEVLFPRAVQQGRALGVISSFLPDYNQPERNRDIIRFSAVPYDPEQHGFALNVSPARAEVLERLLSTGLVYVKVGIDASFADARGRTVVATVGGTLPTAGTIALVGHLDEPGANDNASGISAMAAMAAGYLRAIHDGRLARPRRSITFLFGAEFECSSEWLKSQTVATDLALVVDMVGEDQALTGASALVERMPDPGAIWDRPPLDIHSEWGRSDSLQESDLAGSFLNDYVMEALRLRAERTHWNVRSNPFEGGSDHESFLDRGIPAVLLWHFTDQFYHTNLDRPDKVSTEEMRHDAVAALAIVHHFANAGLQRADEVLDIVMNAARRRLANEAAIARERLSAPAVTADAQQTSAVSRRERAIVVAWSRWYREALLSVESFEPDPSDTAGRIALVARIDEALAELRQLEQDILDTL